MSASNQRDLVDRVRLIRSNLVRPGTRKALGCDLVAHFSYHKCLTSYYRSITRALSAEFGFYYGLFTSDYARFEHAALNDSRQRVLSVNNRSDIPWDRLPEYRGSYFIEIRVILSFPVIIIISEPAKHGAMIRDSSGSILPSIPISDATLNTCPRSFPADCRIRSISTRWTRSGT